MSSSETDRPDRDIASGEAFGRRLAESGQPLPYPLEKYPLPVQENIQRGWNNEQNKNNS